MCRSVDNSGLISGRNRCVPAAGQASSLIRLLLKPGQTGLSTNRLFTRSLFALLLALPTLNNRIDSKQTFMYVCF